MSITESADAYHDEVSDFVLNRSKIELHSMDREEVEEFQLGALQARFEGLVDHVIPLRTLAERNGVSEIKSIEAAAPLMFTHTVYKSYPMSFLENNRFDRMTKWLDQLTTTDLSTLDVSGVESIDDWLAILDGHGLLPAHTTGTSGKLSFFPRSKAVEGQIKHKVDISVALESFGEGTPGLPFGEGRGTQLPIVHPAFRGRYNIARVSQSLQAYLETPDDHVCYLFDDFLSSDIASLTGRIRQAEQKGELGELKLTGRQQEAVEHHKLMMGAKEQHFDRLFERITRDLKGERIVMIVQPPFLFEFAQQGLARGLEGIFAPNSIISMMGGTKGAVLPDDWKQQVFQFFGFDTINQGFGMSEAFGACPTCSERNHHFPVNQIPYLLDYESGATVPRKGRQTGRLAVIDILQTTIWGGYISGDEATVDWNSDCPCGMKSTYIVRDSIQRYSEKFGKEDDKIMCSGAPQAQEAAIKTLLRSMGIEE